MQRINGVACRVLLCRPARVLLLQQQHGMDRLSTERELTVPPYTVSHTCPPSLPPLSAASASRAATASSTDAAAAAVVAAATVAAAGRARHPSHADADGCAATAESIGSQQQPSMAARGPRPRAHVPRRLLGLPLPRAGVGCAARRRVRLGTRRGNQVRLPAHLLPGRSRRLLCATLQAAAAHLCAPLATHTPRTPSHDPVIPNVCLLLRLWHADADTDICPAPEAISNASLGALVRRGGGSTTGGAPPQLVVVASIDEDRDSPAPCTAFAYPGRSRGELQLGARHHPRCLRPTALFNAFIGAAPRHPRLVALCGEALRNIESRRGDEHAHNLRAARRGVRCAPPRGPSRGAAGATATDAHAATSSNSRNNDTASSTPVVVAALQEPSTSTACVDEARGAPPPWWKHSDHEWRAMSIAGPLLLLPLLSEVTDGRTVVLAEFPRQQVSSAPRQPLLARCANNQASARHWKRLAARGMLYYPPGVKAPSACRTNT